MPDLLLSANSKTKENTYNLKAMDICNELEFGATAGIMYDLGSKIKIDLCYVHGLNALIESQYQTGPGMPAQTTKDGENRTFMVGLSYKLIY